MSKLRKKQTKKMFGGNNLNPLPRSLKPPKRICWLISGVSGNPLTRGNSPNFNRVQNGSKMGKITHKNCYCIDCERCRRHLRKTCSSEGLYLSLSLISRCQLCVVCYLCKHNESVTTVHKTYRDYTNSYIDREKLEILLLPETVLHKWC